MAFAPLFFLRGRQPSRTPNWDRPTLTLPDSGGRPFSGYFEWRKGLFVGVQHFPVHDPQSERGTLYHPPPHYHLYADEYFRVIQGGGTWHLWDRDVHLKAGDELKVPARAWHWFEGDEKADPPLGVEMYFDKGQAEVEERFFRNVLGYLADCHREKIEPSICQLLLFFYHFEMIPGLRIVRWETPNFYLNTVVTLIGATIGVLMGCKSSYDEYYRPQKKSQ
ncbi:hypothetical protein PWT90_00494 [Aphanocladium album]|nr:hypothetical protein PWT90_00494 [Aphanocladium album]